jgi:hypothetical protein
MGTLAAMKRLILLTALLAAPSLHAETPRQFIDAYAAEAGRAQPGFAADAARGRAFATRAWGVSEKMANCAACHGDNPRAAGRHAVTGKPIGALSPQVDRERFSDPAKVEKWFKRNCKEVVGRLCTPAEKADFIQFASGV